MIWIEDDDNQSVLLGTVLEGVTWEKDWPCMCCAPLGLSCLCTVKGMDPEECDYKEKSWFGAVFMKLITRVIKRSCTFRIRSR
jgi:hypothetical protein